MSPEPTLEDEDYASSEDSDFAPDDAPEQEGDGESSDDDNDDDENGPAKQRATGAAPSRKRKQAGDGKDAEDAGFENSGDEVIIEKGKKRRMKGRQAQQDKDDEGGEGGVIKTRSMRAVEKAERKTQAVSGPVTVDVDALWASMTAAPVVPVTQESPAPGQATGASTTGEPKTGQAAAATPAEPSEMIKIKRTYKFAGKVHTEEKLVARDSAEARLYLASRGKKSGDPTTSADAAAAADDGGAEAEEDDDDDDKRRMPRKAFRSTFEPVLLLSDGGQRTDLNLGIAVRLQAREKATKLNTVEKSRMDWAGFVDKEGIKDELALAGRAKGSFGDRQDFLARTEARREEDARRVRLAGKV